MAPLASWSVQLSVLASTGVMQVQNLNTLASSGAEYAAPGLHNEMHFQKDPSWRCQEFQHLHGRRENSQHGTHKNRLANDSICGFPWLPYGTWQDRRLTYVIVLYIYACVSFVLCPSKNYERQKFPKKHEEGNIDFRDGKPANAKGEFIIDVCNL